MTTTIVDNTELKQTMATFAAYLHDRYFDESEYETPAEFNAAWVNWCKRQGMTGRFKVGRKASNGFALGGLVEFRVRVTGNRTTITERPFN